MDACETPAGAFTSEKDRAVRIGGWARHRWMLDNAETLASYSLTQICTPGAHNAATYAVKSRSAFACDAPGMLRKSGAIPDGVRYFARRTTAYWARCQSMSVYEQLQFGIRYFDIRLAPDSKRLGALYATHSLLSCSLKEIIGDVCDFYRSEASSGEFIILDFQSIFIDTEEDLQEKFFCELDVIQDRCIHNSVPLATPLQDLWSRSGTERIFVVVGRTFPLAKYPFVFPRHLSVESRWKNKQTTAALLQAFEQEVVERCRQESSTPPQRFNVAQAVLTPGTAEVMRGLFTRYRPSLKHVAVVANPRLLQWFNDWATRREVNGRALPWREGLYRNIIMIDFVEVGCVELRVNQETVAFDVVQLCVHLNRLRHLARP